MNYNTNNTVQSENLENNTTLSKKRITVGLLVIILVCSVLTCLIHRTEIEDILRDTTFFNSGLSTILVIQQEIVPYIGYVLFLGVSLCILNLYCRINELKIAKKFILNIMLVFVLCLLINDMVKLGCFRLFKGKGNYTISKNYKEAVNQLITLKGFSTGLDIFTSSSSHGFFIKCLEGINIFSVLGFSYINIKLNKIKKNNLFVVALLALIFLGVYSMFNSLNLADSLSWK